MNSDSELQGISDYLNVALANHPGAANILPTNSSNVLEKLSDGLLLCFLVNTLSKKGPVIEESTLKIQRPTIFHKLDHSNKALDGAKRIGLGIVNIRAESIVEMKEGAVLGLMNQIMRQSPKQWVEKPVRKPQPPQRQEEQQSQPQQEQRYQPQQEKPYRQEEQPTYEEKTYMKEEPASQPQPPALDPQAVLQKIRQTPINSRPQFLSPQAETGYHIDHAIGLQVLVLVGSLRQNSVNKGIVSALREIKSQNFYENMHFHTPDLSILPLFNVDLEDSQGPKLKVVKDLRDLCRKCNGILVATPEYNGAISPAAKNAFDWLSRTYQSDYTPLVKKKVGVLSSSYLTEQQIKDVEILGEHLNMNVLQNNYYVNLKKGASDMETGNFKNDQERQRLALWYQDFSHFVLSGKDHPEPRPRFLIQ